MSKHLARNTAMLLTGNLGTTALSFVLSMLIGRVLGRTGIGVYGIVMAWVFPARLLAEFGLSSLITRDVAANIHHGPDYLRRTMPVRLISGGILTALLLVGAPLISTDVLVVSGLRISAPLILIEPFFGAYTAIFRAEQIMWPIPLLNLGMLFSQVGLTAWVLVRGGGVGSVMLVNVGTSLAQLIGAWAIYRWRFRRSGVGLELDTRLILRRAWPFALAAVLATLQIRVGVVLSGWLADTGQAGYYTAASRFVEAVRLLPMAFFNALFPALAALGADPVQLDRTFRRVALLLLGMGIGAGCLFAILSEPLVGLTYGAAFEPAIPVLQVMVWALVPGMLRGGRTLYWYARGREAFVNRVIGAAILIQIGFSCWLIPQLGALGATWAMLVSEIALMPVLWWGIGTKNRKGATRRKPLPQDLS